MPRVKKAETRDHILDAARRLFSENGYHDTSVADIIQAVGMAQGSFYNYFKSKNDIFKHLLESFVNEVRETLDRLKIETIKTEADYVQMALQIGSEISHLFLHDKKLTRIFVWEAVGVNQEYDSILDQSYRDFSDYSKRYIEKGKELGIIRDEVNAAIVGSATIGMSIHVITRRLRGDLDDFTDQEIMQSIFDLQLRGILKKKS